MAPPRIKRATRMASSWERMGMWIGRFIRILLILCGVHGTGMKKIHSYLQDSFPYSFLIIEKIVFRKITAARSEDRFMQSEQQTPPVVHVIMKRFDHPVLQFIVEIDDHIPADDQVEIYKEKILILH